MSTDITDRAAQVLQQIDAALAQWEIEVTAGPWHKGGGLNSEVFDGEGRDIVPDCDPDNATFIAASRTLLPASLRCLKTAIEGLLRVAFLETGASDESYVGRVAASTLTTLLDQWEAAK